MQLAQYDPIHLPPANEQGPAPRGTQKISVDEAARRSGLSAGQITRLCRDVWGAQLLALKERPPEGGKPEWMIWEHADPRLARNAPQVREVADLTGFTQAQRDVIAFKQLVLREWGNFVAAAIRMRMDKSAATDHYLQLLEAGRIAGSDGRPVRDPTGNILRAKVSRRTLYNWEAAAKAGPAALVDGRGTKAEETRRDDPYWAEVRFWYLTQNETSIAAVVKLCNARARSEGWEPRTYHTVRRYIQSLPAPVKVLARQGEEAYDNTHGGHVERDYTKYQDGDGNVVPFRVNQIWCGDHHPCDVIVHYKGRLVRPWISGWEDMRSRRVFYAFTPQPPDSNTVLAALANGIRATGMRVPEEVYIDNGKDYDCYMLQGQTKAQRIGRSKFRIQVDPAKLGGVLGGLQIGVRHARPYNPKAKPIERFFRTYAENVDKFEPTYTGNKPENKPEGLEEKVRKFNEAVRAQTPADVAAGIGHVVPSFEEYVNRAAAWIEECYHHEPHHGHGMEIDGVRCSPLQVYNQLLAESANRVISEKAFDIAKLRIERPVKVGRNGQINYNRLKYGRGQPELIAMQGQPVVIRVDVQDIKRVSVWTADGRFVCHATECTRVPWGTSLEAAKQAARQEREQKRAARKLGLSPMVVARSAVDLMIENSIAERATRPPLPPAPPPGAFRPIQTGFEQQHDMYEASEAKAVVGGADAHPRASALDRLSEVTQAPRLAARAEKVSPLDRIRIGRPGGGGGGGGAGGGSHAG